MSGPGSITACGSSNRATANPPQYHLGRIKQICGTDCSEYKSLAMALDQPAGTGLVY